MREWSDKDKTKLHHEQSSSLLENVGQRKLPPMRIFGTFPKDDQAVDSRADRILSKACGKEMVSMLG